MKKSRQARKDARAKAFTRPPKAAKAKARAAKASLAPGPPVPVDVRELHPSIALGPGPSFVAKGFYEDLPFTCRACKTKEVWPAAAQKWWYEVAKGYPWSTAVYCRACRTQRKEKKAEARRVHLEGLARKQKRKGADA